MAMNELAFPTHPYLPHTLENYGKPITKIQHPYVMLCYAKREKDGERKK